MAGVEFLGTDGVDDADAELDTAPTGIVGRAIGSVVAALLVVGIVVWAVSDHSAHRRQAVAATSVAPVPQPSVVDIPGRWRVPGLRASDPVAADPVISETYALSDGRDLYSIGPTGGLLSYHRADTARGRLVVDTVHHVVWVLPGDGEPAALEAYAGTTLRTVAATYLHAPVTSGGVLDGQLYVTLRTSPVQLVPVNVQTSALEAPVDVPAGVDTASMAVDADHHRLIFLGSAPAGRTQIWDWSRAAGWTRTESVAIGGASVVALRDTVWVAGVSGHGAAAAPILTRVEPDGLTPDLGRGPAARFTLVAGKFALFVRDRTDGSLWCIDPETTEILQRWANTAGLVSTSQNVLTSAAGRLVPLDAGSCPG